jgi:hypothetical protein
MARFFRNKAVRFLVLAGVSLLWAPAIFASNRAIMEGINAGNSAIFVSTGTAGPSSSRVSVQNLSIVQLSAGQCLQTTTGGAVTTAGTACVGSGSTFFIGNQNTLQAGATFYVSSGTVQNLTAGTLVAGSGIFSGALTANSVTATGLPPNQCVQTNGSSQLTTTGQSCAAGGGGGGSGGSALQVMVGNVVVSSPTTNVSYSSAFTGSLIGPSTAFVDVNYASVTARGNTFNGASQLVLLDGSGNVPSVTLANAIKLQNTLQSGATFYVSSGTIAGPFNTTGIINTNSSYQLKGNTFLTDSGSNVGSLLIGNTGNTGLATGGTTCAGYQSCTALTTGSNVTAYGYRAGTALTTGVNLEDVCVGGNSCFNATTSNRNACLGFNSCFNLTTSVGGSNVGIGDAAMINATTAGNDTCVGEDACDQLTVGINDTAIGPTAMGDVTTGNGNTCVGANGLGTGQACTGIKTGSNNTMMGVGASAFHGSADGSSTGNTILGAGAGLSNSAPINNSICIGIGCVLTSSNTAQIGGQGANAVTVLVSTLTASSVTVTGNFYNNTLVSGNCVQAGVGGLLTTTAGACGGGGGTPGGSSSQIQWNSGGAFAGAANTSVTSSSITVNEPVLVGGLTDTGLSPSLPVLTDVNKQLVTGNIPLASVSGVLAVSNGGTGLGTAPNDSVLTGNGSSWQANAVPSCSGAAQATQFNTGTDAFGCLSQIGVLNSTQTWTGANNWTTVSQSTFAFGVAVGSLTVSGPGNGQILLTVNGTTGTVTSSSQTPVVGGGVIWTSTNGTLGNGLSAASLLASTNTWTGVNTWTTTGVSSYTYGVQASTLTLATLNQFGGQLTICNSGNQNNDFAFFSDGCTSAMGNINLNQSGWFRITDDLNGYLGLQTADTDRLRIEYTSGNVGINEHGPANAQLGVSGAAANTYSVAITTYSGGFHVAVSTTGDIVTASSNTTMGTCGTTPSVVGDNNEGIITVGGGVVTACTMNFANGGWGAGCNVVCSESDNSTTVTGDISALSSTSVTFSFSATLGGGLIYYQCRGYGIACR